MSVKFRATILTGGGTTAGIVVPDDKVAELGAGKKPADFGALREPAPTA